MMAIQEAVSIEIEEARDDKDAKYRVSVLRVSEPSEVYHTDNLEVDL